MTAPAGSSSSDPRSLLLVCPTPRLVTAATEAGFQVVTVADPAGFTDDQLRDHLAETIRTHRVGMLIACGEASTLPAVLETAERLGVSPNPAAAARLLADASQIRGLMTRSGPQWEALTLPTGPEGGPPPYDIEYGVETLTAEGMHRVTGIVELRFTGRGAPRADSGPGPGPGDGPTGTVRGGAPLHTFPAPITRQEEAEIRALATGLLDLAGYEFGYAFTRIARTDEGPRVIESLPRQASWPTSRLIELTTGLVPERELVRALSGSPPEAPAMVGCAAAVPLPDPSGAPDRITALADVREVRDGHVLLTALTPAELATRTAAVLDGRV
ncbi:hypothetical protein ACFYZN_34345 [Streptomyces sp. NPDC001777]|uniref:hypothetical protein n=1 Tax=Streptomyces sp. NPDC001777 TaxID=3364608 RepID=UPI0036792B34